MKWLSFGKRNRAGSSPQVILLVDDQAVPGCAKRIFMVDDDAVIIKTTSAKLKSHGYQVAAAMDAAEAMSAISQTRPDLILLDVSFPPDVGSVDWDGFKIMEWLQLMDETRSIHIIITTGGEPMNYKARSLATGAVAFFNRPLQHDELPDVTSRLLRIESRQAAPLGA